MCDRRGDIDSREGRRSECQVGQSPQTLGHLFSSSVAPCPLDWGGDTSGGSIEIETLLTSSVMDRLGRSTMTTLCTAVQNSPLLCNTNGKVGKLRSGEVEQSLLVLGFRRLVIALPKQKDPGPKEECI